jgi:hypothetical protein
MAIPLNISPAEALALKGIALHEPPIRAEDDTTETTILTPNELSVGNARTRLSNLIRTTSRERAPRKTSFCPLEDAVAALTSSMRTEAMLIGAARVESQDHELFEAYFFLLDIEGGASIDKERAECIRADLKKARQHDNDDDGFPAISSESFMRRITRVQSNFGHGSLTKSEIEVLADQVCIIRVSSLSW